MKIFMPSRILDRHVGGNTTYARRISEGIIEFGHELARIPATNNALTTMVRETVEGRKRGRPNEVLHYVADTGLLTPARRPSVVTVHGVASLTVEGVRSPAKEAIWRFRVGRAIASADHVITVSNSSALDIEHVFGVNRASMSVIPHGIDSQVFSTPTELSDKVREIVPKEFALYLGNIEPRKNVRSLVDAFASDKLSSLGVPLVIAGKPAWDFQEAMDAIERNPNVIHLGFVSDTDRTALMQRCLLFVFPSLYEGFGFPVLEALASGCVVASSRRGSLKEVAGPSLELEALDAEGLADGIATALTNQVARTKCIRDGKAWASKFSWDESIRAHLGVYERVLS
ncbi:glycosyltransferase family 4 protein [Arthrobacter sp. USHLN218]|uniref:glycosyltransferase family 4 protein n=1 Tax=Arthrobacter sp. USHLN218 TaxID=3081232 RepID=UPI0030177614